MSVENEKINFKPSAGMGTWLAQRRIGIVCSICAPGAVAFFYGNEDGEVVCSMVPLSRWDATGIAISGGRIYVATRRQIWRFENIGVGDVLDNGGIDYRFCARNIQLISGVDARELIVESSGRLVFASARYSCLATLNHTLPFVPIWKPSFISSLHAEDRCHLNGVALDAGRARYVSARAVCDTSCGWLETQLSSGIIIDIESNKIIADGLGMPHSPRVHDNALYVLESAHGMLVRVDLENGHRENIAFCEGYPRGTVILDKYAFVAVSAPITKDDGIPLPLEQAMEKRSVSGWSGIALVDLENGEVIEKIRFEGKIVPIYNVGIIPNVARLTCVTER